MKARDFAIQEHGNQMYGDKPYIYHLDAVVAVGNTYREYIPDPYWQDVEDALYLHDWMEDVRPGGDLTKHGFSMRTDTQVWSVTDKEGKNRVERHMNTYPLLALSYQGVFIKLCDRIANISACVVLSDPRSANKMEMYQGEYEYFRNTLRTAGQFDKMWNLLDLVLGYGVIA